MYILCCWFCSFARTGFHCSCSTWAQARMTKQALARPVCMAGPCRCGSSTCNINMCMNVWSYAIILLHRCIDKEHEQRTSITKNIAQSTSITGSRRRMNEAFAPNLSQPHSSTLN